MNWYLKCLRQYADFNGRARRTEYWMFVLFNFIVTVILSMLSSLGVIFAVLCGLYALAVIIPGLAVSVRRMHDLGKSGVWVLITLVPLIGGIWFLVLTLLDSQLGTNQYGPNPKGLENNM